MEPLATVDKAVDVLFHLHGATSAQGVSAIGRALGLPKSSAHRLLAALRRRELVERDAGGRYRPGIGLVSLGLGALSADPVVTLARPVLESEAEALGETVFLVAARAGRLVVLDKVEGTGFLRAAPRIGSAVPVHSTAVGKLHLAFADAAVPVPRGRLERFSEQTLTDRAELARAVEEVRQRGHAESWEEWIPGLAVVAAPILVGERMHGAIAVAATSARMRDLGARGVARRTRAAADRVAANLSGGDR